MAKSKKSKILAMALCASVMTGIYASPVMAAKLYEYNGSEQWVTTNAGTEITSLEGLEEITLGDSVKITTDGKGIIRVGNLHGVNTRVHDDGFYINETGNDQKTSLTAGTLTLAGNTLTSAQLANIKSVIDEVGGISRAGTTDENRSTYIEKTVRVNNNSGLVVYAEDGTTFAAQIDREGNVLTEGVGRFGAFEGPNVRMENGVLTVNSTGETDVAKLNAEGLTLTSDTTEATLSAEQIARLNTVVTQNGESIVVTADHFKNTNNSFAVDSNGAVRAADGKFKVGANGAVRAADGKFNVGANGAVRAADGKFNVGADGDVAIQYAGDGVIVADENGFAVQKGSAQAVVTNDGVGLAAGLKADGKAAARISVTDDGIGLQGGTSEVVLNSNNGAVFTNGEGNGETVINGGSITTNRITTGTVNGVAIGMNADGDITLGNNVVIDGDFNSDNIAGITRDDRNDSEPGSEVTYIEKNTAVSADGIVVKDSVSGVSTKTKYDGFYVKDKDSKIVSSLKDDGLMLTDPGSGVSTKTKYDGFYVKDKDSKIVSSLKNDGLMLTDQESGKTHTLNATDIADIKGIDRSGNDTDGKTTIEGATSFTKDGMVTSNITTNSFTAGVTEDSIYHINAKGEMLFRSGDNYIGMNRDRIGFTSGTESVTINGEGTTFTSGDSTTRTTTSTVIKGGTIKTGTLEVENIKLGDSMTDKNGNNITIGAAGVIDIKKEGNTVFHADTDNFEAHYDNYDLTLDGTYGFALSKGRSSFTLKDDGFAFAGPVHLGDGTQVKFRHNGTTDISLSSLVDRVEDLEQKTQGISFDETTGSTTIADKVGTDGVESNNSMTVGNNGTTFENGTDSKTNINGGAIDADSSSIGDNVSGGSGSGSIGMTGDGTYTDGSQHSGHFEYGDNIYEFTNNAYGFTGTVTDDEHTTTIKNGAMGSNTTVTGEDNTSASSGVGIGNDGAFISDSVTNGDMTVTEVKDKNGSATTVKDANGSSTVSQDTNGQTVSTGTGTSVNTGKDFSVTDTETGKSIYMSDIGHVEDIDSEIQNSDGSKTTVVDAVNNEAEISRNEIERVDGRINNLENRVGKLEDRVDKVGAMAAAIANLRTMGYDPAAPTEVAVGIGQYRDETGAALGLFHYPNRDFMLSLSVSTSGDEVMGGIGATWKFGRKSPEKVAEIKKAQAEADARRAEEAKLAKAEEIKQAAKEAKIKAQQERHAKLAAQAEAAK